MPGDPYYEILREMSRARVKFILGGGLACVLQGAERVTMDVDVAVLMEPTNLRAFLATMECLKLRPRVPVPPSALLDPEAVAAMHRTKGALVFTFVDPDQPHRQVDVFLDPKLGYERMLADSEELDLGSMVVRVLTKKKLLELKLGIHPARTKDLVDIEFLQRHVEAPKTRRGTKKGPGGDQGHQAGGL